jgi:hypothetical protein
MSRTWPAGHNGTRSASGLLIRPPTTLHIREDIGTLRVTRKTIPGTTIVDGVQLTGPMVSVLLEHVTGERALKVSDADTLRALRARGLIRYNRAVRPWRTIVTTRGKNIMTTLLGRMADVLASREAAEA